MFAVVVLAVWAVAGAIMLLALAVGAPLWVAVLCGFAGGTAMGIVGMDCLRARYERRK